MITLSLAFNMKGTFIEKVKMLISMLCLDATYILPMIFLK